MADQIAQTCATLAVLGVISHLSVFIRLNSVDSAPRLVLFALTAPFVGVLALNTLLRLSINKAILTVAAWFFSYVGAAFVSMTLYRTCFHPLRSYPGTFWDQVTQFHLVSKIWKRVDHFRQIDKLHKQYGDYVRVGPNLLSVTDPNIVQAVHASGSKFRKGEWYEPGKPMVTLHQMTDPAMHDRRRRHGWDKAFTTKALRSYDGRLIKYTDQLIDQLRRRSGQVVNAREWVHYFAFDVMGDLAFGKSFHALERGQSHFAIDVIHDSGALTGIFGSARWVIHLLMQLPIPPSLSTITRLINYSADMIKERKTYEPEEPDVMSHIFEAGPFFDNPETESKLLTGDARLLIIAGSDTTASSLTFLLYHLARDPSLVERLREELEQDKIGSGHDFAVANLGSLNYLNALIYECLRLHPPVAGGVYRESPDEGITIDGHYIPGGVTVLTPNYTIQRSPKSWVKPDEFIPERWTTQPELIIHKDTWFPFLTGKYGCIGKQLAMNEMRTVIAKIVLELDVSFAKGETGRALLEDSRDTFTTDCAKLELIFTRRK